MKETFIKMVVDAWNAQNKQLDKLLGELSDEKIEGQVAPGKNSGIYLLGHLIAVSDNMLVLLDGGPALHPELKEVFLTSPDSAGTTKPSVEMLKKYRLEINQALDDYFQKLSPEGWMERHTSVSAEDFSKEPHRNKLNILISRTNHHAYHLGQLVLLK